MQDWLPLLGGLLGTPVGAGSPGDRTHYMQQEGSIPRLRVRTSTYLGGGGAGFKLQQKEIDQSHEESDLDQPGKESKTSQQVKAVNPAPHLTSSLLPWLTDGGELVSKEQDTSFPKSSHYLTTSSSGEKSPYLWEDWRVDWYLGLHIFKNFIFWELSSIQKVERIE